MGRMLVSSVGLALVLFAGAAQAQDAVLTQIYGSGVHAFFAQDYRAAFDELSRAVDSGTKDPRVYYFRGLALQRLGRPEDAQVDFETGAELETKDVNRVFNVSKALERVQGSGRVTLERQRLSARMAARTEAERVRKSRYEEMRKQEDAMSRRAAEGASTGDEPPQIPPAGGAGDIFNTPPTGGAPGDTSVPPLPGEQPTTPTPPTPSTPAAPTTPPEAGSPFDTTPTPPTTPTTPTTPGGDNPFDTTPVPPTPPTPATPATPTAPVTPTPGGPFDSGPPPGGVEPPVPNDRPPIMTPGSASPPATTGGPRRGVFGTLGGAAWRSAIGGEGGAPSGATIPGAAPSGGVPVLTPGAGPARPDSRMPGGVVPGPVTPPAGDNPFETRTPTTPTTPTAPVPAIPATPGGAASPFQPEPAAPVTPAVPGASTPALPTTPTPPGGDSDPFGS